MKRSTSYLQVVRRYLRAEMVRRGVNPMSAPYRKLRNPPFGASPHKFRDAGEQLFKIKHYRAIATLRKHPESYPVIVKLAAAGIWIRSMSR